MTKNRPLDWALVEALAEEAHTRLGGRSLCCEVPLEGGVHTAGYFPHVAVTQLCACGATCANVDQCLVTVGQSYENNQVM